MRMLVVILVLRGIDSLVVGLHVPLGDIIPNSNMIERNWVFWSLFSQVNLVIARATSSSNARK